jgi:hypothetical protein
MSRIAIRDEWTHEKVPGGESHTWHLSLMNLPVAAGPIEAFLAGRVVLSELLEELDKHPSPSGVCDWSPSLHAAVRTGRAFLRLTEPEIVVRPRRRWWEFWK